MRRHTISIMMASAAILGSSIVGCSNGGADRRAQLASDQGKATPPRIERALQAKDYARALLLAEQLVTAEPRNGDYRALLGRAYLSNGRYVSARTAFNDALTLGNRDSRTIVSLALCQTGLGDPTAARALLAEHAQTLPAGDYGLAVAMAGDAREAIQALLVAVKQPDATSKTRQNLAYALAMAGYWGQARLIAGQDLPAKDAEERIGQWAWSFLEGKEKDRVVAMIGVSPREDDAGLPTQLALDASAPADGAPVQLAAGEDNLIQDAGRAARLAEAIEATQDAPPAAPAAPAEPTVDAVLAAAFQRADESAAPLLKAPAEPMRQTIRAAFTHSAARQEPLAGRARMSSVSRIGSPASDGEASDWVIQLGAFSSDAVAREKWRRIGVVSAALKAYRPVNSVFQHGGRTYYRLAVRGFGDRAVADATCSTLRTAGQSCFVRLDDTDATRQARAGAQRGSSQVALN